MPSILLVEDDLIQRLRMRQLFNKALPDYDILDSATLENALDIARPVISDLRVVFTDGQLDREGGGRDYGWEFAEYLQGDGYKGPVVYVSNTPIPEGKQDLFSRVIPKGELEEDVKIMIEYVQSLPAE